MATAETAEEDDWHEHEERLYYCILSNDVTCLKRMLDTDGHSVNTKFEGMNQLDKSMLHLACEVGSSDIVQHLLESGARLNITDAWFQTPVFYCVSTRRSDILEMLLNSRRTDVNHQDRYGKTALHLEIEYNDLECLDLLLSAKKLDLDLRDDTGKTPLACALWNDGKVEVIRKLIEAGCNINKETYQDNRTPLHHAILRSKQDTLEYIKLLLDAGACPNTLDCFGHTPLMSLMKKYRKEGPSVSDDELEIARVLLEAGHLVDITTFGKFWFQYSGNALKMATERGALRLVDLILQYGGDPNLHDENMVTALLVAADRNMIDIGKKLMQYNCRMAVCGTVTINGEKTSVNPFQCCILKEHWQFAEMMVNCGYDLRNENYLWTNDDVPNQLVLNTDFWMWLIQSVINPKTLLFTCVMHIRDLFGFPLKENLDKLPVPNRVRDLIMFKHVHQCYAQDDAEDLTKHLYQ